MRRPTDHGKKQKIASILLHLLCIAAVMAAAVLVRIPAALYGDGFQDAYTDENGLPYLTDMDSYYHVRLVDNYLNDGILGDRVLEDGTEWDEHSSAPEGRSAEYQPGIVWLTAGLWRLLGGSLDALEYRLAAFISALAALAAYIFGWRVSGRAGGLTAGLLVGCAPQFAARTCYGRFDTDMFVVLMEVLLILLLTESLRSPSRWRRVLFAAGFALAAALYSLCWMPKYTALFAGLTLFGGALFLLTLLFAGPDRPRTAREFFSRPEFFALILCAVLAAAGLAAAAGFSVFANMLSVVSFSTSTSAGEGVLPNLFASVSELSRARLFPGSLVLSFTGYVRGASPAVINGVGGAVAMLSAAVGIILLVLLSFPRFRRRLWAPSRRDCAMYACVLGAWLAAGLFLMRYGIRFIEHLAISVGLLAGILVGLLYRSAVRWAGKKPRGWEQKKDYWLKKLLPCMLCAAAVIPAVTGSVRAVADVRPSVSDASVKAMGYMAGNTQQDAVIASWWDMGYFYESDGDRPCLWDGGTQGGVRAILISKALVTDDMELSRRILLMLSSSGNAAVVRMMEYADAETAFETLWQALRLERDEAVALLETRCAMTAEAAAETEELIHPAQARETYLIITYTMTRQIGWYEYYAGWDFTGEQALPSATLYSYTPDGTPIFNTEAGQTYLDSVRGKETMWQLFFNAERTPCFTPAFEWHDGLEHVRIWRVEP